jgi:hypothetical protein
VLLDIRRQAANRSCLSAAESNLIVPRHEIAGRTSGNEHLASSGERETYKEGKEYGVMIGSYGLLNRRYSRTHTRITHL